MKFLRGKKELDSVYNLSFWDAEEKGPWSSRKLFKLQFDRSKKNSVRALGNKPFLKINR